METVKPELKRSTITYEAVSYETHLSPKGARVRITIETPIERKPSSLTELARQAIRKSEFRRVEEKQDPKAGTRVMDDLEFYDTTERESW